MRWVRTRSAMSRDLTGRVFLHTSSMHRKQQPLRPLRPRARLIILKNAVKRRQRTECLLTNSVARKPQIDFNHYLGGKTLTILLVNFQNNYSKRCLEISYEIHILIVSHTYDIGEDELLSITEFPKVDLNYIFHGSRKVLKCSFFFILQSIKY